MASIDKSSITIVIMEKVLFVLGWRMWISLMKVMVRPSGLSQRMMWRMKELSDIIFLLIDYIII